MLQRGAASKRVNANSRTELVLVSFLVRLKYRCGNEHKFGSNGSRVTVLSLANVQWTPERFREEIFVMLGRGEKKVTKRLMQYRV